MEESMNIIGERIKKRRKELKLTQTDIYNECGISSGTLSKIENGFLTPSILIFYKISQVLKCNMEWLLTGDSIYSKNKNSEPFYPNNSTENATADFKEPQFNYQEKVSLEEANNIGARIRQRRKELSLTQTKIKELTGISSGNLSDIENGNKLPSTNAIISLSEALDCTTDWILKGESPECEIISVNEEPYESELLEYFRGMLSYDQEDLLMIAEMKYRKAKEHEKSSHSQTEQMA